MSFIDGKGYEHNPDRLARDRKRAAIGGLVVVALFAALAFQAVGDKAFDTETQCPNTEWDDHHTVVLIDWSNGFSDAQWSEMLDTIVQAHENLPESGRISLYAIDGNQRALPRTLNTSCRRPISNNLLGASRTRQERQAKPSKENLEQAISQVSNTTESDSSPLLETIQMLSIHEPLRFTDKVRERRLLIFSDMAQYEYGSKLFGSCNKFPSFQSFRDSSTYEKLKPNIAGVDVDVFYVKRAKGMCAGQAQRSANLEQFWLDFFAHEEATMSPPRFFPMTAE